LMAFVDVLTLPMIKRIYTHQLFVSLFFFSQEKQNGLSNKIN
jgi:hypothetical protein